MTAFEAFLDQGVQLKMYQGAVTRSSKQVKHINGSTGTSRTHYVFVQQSFVLHTHRLVSVYGAHIICKQDESILVL